jgi:NADH-quinone oxidoreductase subunit N
MNSQDFIALLPLLILAGSSILIMLLIAVKFSHRIIELVSLVLFALSFLALFYINSLLPHSIAPLFIVDSFSLLIIGVIIFSSLIVTILSYVYFDEKEEGPKEYYVLLFLSALGAGALAASNHFVSLFLGLETLTVALYGLISYLRARSQNIEAGMKYLILAAFSSAFLLFGMALVYLEVGTMEFSAIAQKIAGREVSPLFVTGLGMMMAGIGFKLAVVPFHMWTADVYQGAPAPVTAFIATASKGGVFAVLLRFFLEINAFQYPVVLITLMVIAIASMLIGNLLALQQTNVKRILAYSSIAHLGYLLVAFLPGSAMSTEAVTFYIIAYSLSILTAFGIVTILSTKEHDAEEIENYRSLFWNNPLLACIFSSALLSLAGIPLTAGFIGKFYVLAAGVQQGFWLPAIVLVLSSVVGLYYYLRIITVMFSGKKSIISTEKNAHPVFYVFSSAALSLLALLILWFGVNPSGLIGIVNGLF